MALEIADCNHTIRLEFDVDTWEGRENSLHKLDTLEIAKDISTDPNASSSATPRIA